MPLQAVSNTATIIQLTGTNKTAKRCESTLNTLLYDFLTTYGNAQGY